jgi:hypothetical protein
MIPVRAAAGRNIRSAADSEKTCNRRENLFDRPLK